ncbi:hypothetical protein A6P54_02525 [Bacillus sp. MKU004]|nr:hypothetical protein A6P54_02525 [Bacillus sp. MKU004]
MIKKVQDLIDNSVLTIGDGYRAKNSELSKSGIPFLRVGNIKEGFDFSNVDYFPTGNLHKVRNKVSKLGDVVFTSKGTVGKVFQVQEDTPDFVYSPQLCYWRVLNNSILLPEYLYYWLQSKQFKEQVDAVKGQTDMADYVSLADQRRMNISIPEISIQNAIIKILGVIDEKIKLNRQINRNLENLSMSLYKYWFVDYGPFEGGEFIESELGMIPQGWNVKSLKELTSKFCTGLNPRKNFKLGQGNNFYVTIKNLRDNELFLDEKCDKVDDEAIKVINRRSDLQKGDLLFSGIGTIGRVYFIDEEPTNWNISESIFTLRSNSSVTEELLYMILLSPNLQDYAQSSASGSVQKGVRKRDLENYKIALPNKKLIDTFTNTVSQYIDLIKANEKEIEKLKNVREYLLPSLLSGDVDVTKVEILLEEAL